jgi:dihydroflavonol-4-reductase
MNPGLIVGPSIVNDDFTSGQYIAGFMGGAFSKFPKVCFPVVDVRDVSKAHLRGIKMKAAKGRYNLTQDVYSFKELSDMLKAHFGYRYPFATEEMAECPPGDKRFEALWGHKYKIDVSKATKELNI